MPEAKYYTLPSRHIIVVEGKIVLFSETEENSEKVVKEMTGNNKAEKGLWSDLLDFTTS